MTLAPQPQGFGVTFRLTLVTSDPILAAAADRSDVDYVGVDLDVIGKAARQSDKDSRLSDHKPEDLAIIGASVTRAKLFARVNPINPQTPFEIENVLRRGAQAIMLPYFRTVEEVAEFVRMVANRAQISILLETASAAVRIREIVAVPGIQEVMVGLNDLRRELRVANHFELLASPLLDALAQEVRDAGLALAIGGVAHPARQRASDPPGSGAGPVSTDRGHRSLAVALSPAARHLGKGFRIKRIRAIRARLTAWGLASPQSLEAARRELADRARRLAAATVNSPAKIDLYTRCWNDAHMLGFMFRNYDDLVQRYVVYDDGSTDGSLDILAAHPKVEIRDQAAYRNPSSRILAALSLLETCWHESRGRADWVIVCDIDEHLYHPKIDLYLNACKRAENHDHSGLGLSDDRRRVSAPRHTAERFADDGCPF